MLEDTSMALIPFIGVRIEKELSGDTEKYTSFLSDALKNC